MPLMKYRLAAPAVLVDIGRLSDLSYIRDDGDQIAHRCAHPPPRRRDQRRCSRAQVPLLPDVASPRRRSRRCVTAAPSAVRSPTAIRPPTCPSVILALGATLVATAADGRARDRRRRLLHRLPRDRARPRRAAHRDPRAEGAGRRRGVPEVQPARPGLGHRRRAPSVVGDGFGGVGLVNMDSRRRAAPAGGVRGVARGASAADAADAAADGGEPPTDLNASVEYRQHLAEVLVRRAARGRVRRVIGVGAWRVEIAGSTVPLEPRRSPPTSADAVGRPARHDYLRRRGPGHGDLPRAAAAPAAAARGRGRRRQDRGGQGARRVDAAAS